MKTVSLSTILLIIVNFSSTKLFSQASNITTQGFTMKQYTVKEGLSSNGILDMYQDHDGFLWIGTYAGFMRFDGWQMEHIDKETIKGFRNSFYTSGFAQANDGRLFIATHGALVINDGDAWQVISTEDGLPSNVIEGIYL